MIVKASLSMKVDKNEKDDFFVKETSMNLIPSSDKQKIMFFSMLDGGKMELNQEGGKVLQSLLINCLSHNLIYMADKFNIPLNKLLEETIEKIAERSFTNPKYQDNINVDID